VKTERLILAGLAVLGLVAAFWFGLLSPKRAELAKLDKDVESAESALAEQEQLLAAATEAKEDYARNYQRLVVLGKAAPTDDDAAGLIVQVNELARDSRVDFRSLVLASSGGGGAAPAAPPVATETTVDGETSGEAAEPAAPAAPAAPATEASAATLPIGATVGSAGLPVMPYDLNFRGDFFEIADFMAGLDGLVASRSAAPGVNGRLITVDGFSLAPDPEAGFPRLEASLHVTTYVTPADQGVTAGGTASAPPASVPAATVPVATE
jgi:Tfp pilus assembly protein PilO